jgi:uncharacterized protein YodC (DUF2158 family)
MRGTHACATPEFRFLPGEFVAITDNDAVPPAAPLAALTLDGIAGMLLAALFALMPRASIRQSSRFYRCGWFHGTGRAGDATFAPQAAATIHCTPQARVSLA